MKVMNEVPAPRDGIVTEILVSNEEMYANYPYHFRLEITYTVTGKTIRTQYKIYNKESEKSMPFFISSAICLAVPARSSPTDENSWISTFEPSLFACAVNCFDSPSIV